MIVLAIVGGLVAFIGAKVLITPKYTASTTMLVNRAADSTDANTQYTAQQADVQLITTYKGILTSPTILDTVAKNLTQPRKVMTKKPTKAVYGRKYNSYTDSYSSYLKTKAKPAEYKLVPAKYQDITGSDLTDMVSVTNETNSQLFTVNVENTSATEARDIANEIASVFRIKISKIMSVKNVTIMSRATADYTPTSPNLKLLALIGVVLGIIIGFAWGFVREVTDRTIKSLDFITDDLGLTNLGIVNYVHKMKSIDAAKASSTVANKRIDSDRLAPRGTTPAAVTSDETDLTRESLTRSRRSGSRRI
ncbi:chain length regulator (capsular polysaccharide biosynthesis) [Lacticaseibacillus thailandensis DSM 22698 = JCM 13996]|uniref:Capsular polysaccharide biosynthesis protein CpsC n=2 Tax=Lacticaseibacillus thailandensis TaxID=381741 RepID=A0A0R2C8N4_9LACO|nr:chain length regulator (capsular polysaccharide biosynthesis) [Lacticaseibacillus thailandensis DSM 22698 = JCM 13996]